MFFIVQLAKTDTVGRYVPTKNPERKKISRDLKYYSFQWNIPSEAALDRTGIVLSNNSCSQIFGVKRYSVIF